MKSVKLYLKSLSSWSPFHSRTALHLACSKAHKEIIIHLCSLNANVNLQDGDGATPMHKVRRGGVCNALQLMYIHEQALVEGGTV